jgi:DNA-binding XRE family transcriptional regulator
MPLPTTTSVNGEPLALGRPPELVVVTGVALFSHPGLHVLTSPPVVGGPSTPKVTVQKQLNSPIGEAIKTVRAERSMSQEELGRRSGLHRAHVGEIERGEISPTLDSVQLISAALDVQPSHLVALAENYAPSG